MGAKSSLPHRGCAQCGVEDVLVFPVVILHSEEMCRSIRTFGSSPGGIATGVLHSGPTRVRQHISTHFLPTFIQPRKGKGEREGLTRRRDPIHSMLIVLLALVCLGPEMGGTEWGGAVLAFEWEEIDEVAGGKGALVAD